VGPAPFNSIDALDELVLPDDPNLIDALIAAQCVTDTRSTFCPTE